MIVHYSEILEVFAFCFIAGAICGQVVRHSFIKWKNNLFKETDTNVDKDVTE
jgi:hypothetical protein